MLLADFAGMHKTINIFVNVQPVHRKPFLTDNWSRKLQNDRMSGGRSLTSSGQPAMIVSTSSFSTASSDVSRLTLSSRSVEKRTKSTRRSRSIVVTLSGLGNRDKVCEPGRCVIVKLYLCNWMNIRCSLGGADAMKPITR